ncbi:cell surface protein [Haloferacaceae archaeon DSL9]
MQKVTTRRKFIASGVVGSCIALAGCVGGDDDDDSDGTDDTNDTDTSDDEMDGGEGDDDGSEASVSSYEVWALDQGTDIIYVYTPDGDGGFEEIEAIDLHEVEGVIETEHYVPHMIDFSSDYEYAAVACTAGSQTLVFRTEDYELVEALETGPGSHFAGFTPDDEHIQVDVIGEGTIRRIDVDLAEESFEIGDDIALLDDPAIQDHADEFEEANPICHDHAGGYSYHTLGPAVDHAGLVVLDTEAFEVERVYSKEELRTNCGTIAHPDGDTFYLTAGAPSNHETGGVGEWYVLDAESHRPYDAAGELVEEDAELAFEDLARDSDGYDAHGFWFTPDASELWLLNRESDNGLVIDPETDEVVDEIDDYGPAPDIVWGSPDGEYMFVTLRGPNPQSGDPHASEGETPGFSVMNVENREIETVIQPDEGNDESDFHGIGVRPVESSDA